MCVCVCVRAYSVAICDSLIFQHTLMCVRVCVCVCVYVYMCIYIYIYVYIYIYIYMSQQRDRCQVQLASEHADKNETNSQPEGPAAEQSDVCGKIRSYTQRCGTDCMQHSAC